MYLEHENVKLYSICIHGIAFWMASSKNNYTHPRVRGATNRAGPHSIFPSSRKCLELWHALLYNITILILLLYLNLKLPREYRISHAWSSSRTASSCHTQSGSCSVVWWTWNEKSQHTPARAYSGCSLQRQSLSSTPRWPSKMRLAYQWCCGQVFSPSWWQKHSAPGPQHCLELVWPPNSPSPHLR